MPPKTAKAAPKATPKAASKKRALADTDANAAPSAPAPKKSKASSSSKDSSKEQPPADKGKGKSITPQRIMPAEAAPSLHKMLIPPFWIMAIDATPDRDATLGNREWWAAHDLWLQANKKALKMKVAAWKRREVELAKPWEPKPDEGNDDWDFVCLHAHRGSHEEDSEPEDEYGDEESEDGDTQAKDNSAKDKDDGAKDKRKEHDEHNHGPVGKLASLHPDHVPVATMRGRDHADWWLLETLKRDPDEFSMHVYNDFAYYGAMEVLEKIVGSHFPESSLFPFDAMQLLVLDSLSTSPPSASPSHTTSTSDARSRAWPCTSTAAAATS